MSEARRNGQEPLESWLKSLPCAESFFAYYLYCYTASSSCWQPNRSKLQQRFPFIQSAVNNIMVMFLALDLVKSVESLCFWGVVSGVASAMHWHQEAARIQHPRGLQHAQGYQRKGFCQSLFFLKYIQQAFSCVLPLVSFLLLRDWCLLFVIRSLRIFFHLETSKPSEGSHSLAVNPTCTGHWSTLFWWDSHGSTGFAHQVFTQRESVGSVDGGSH